MNPTAKRVIAVLTVATVGQLLSPLTVDADTSPASTSWQVGPMENILGPSPDVDSLYSTVQGPDGRWHGYVAGRRGHGADYYDQNKDESLTNRRLMLKGSAWGNEDDCGVWPVGQIYKVTPQKWVTFFHEEQGLPADGKCVDGHTRWRIRRMVSYDGGAHWYKKATVITQDTALTGTGNDWNIQTDDTGSPRLVLRGNYMYLFYRATNRNSGNTQQMSIARAPLDSLGVAGAWKKWYDGSFSQPGLGGQQDPITSLPATARGISYNSYLNRYLSVMAVKEGLYLYASDGDDFFHWTKLGELVHFGGEVSPWKKPCEDGKLKGTDTPFPLAAGYASIRGYAGGWGSGQKFYVYYMYKPEGKCFDERYLRRRLITLDPGLN